MINPFFHSEERRLRSLLRILFFLFLFGITAGLPSFLPYASLEYIVRGVAIVGLVFIFYRYVDLRAWREAGMQLNRVWFQECLAGIGIAALTMALIFLTEWGSGGIEFTGFGWERREGMQWMLPVAVFFIQMLSVGVYEEVMSRSYLIPNIAEGFTFGPITPKTGAIIGVLLSSMLFGLMHATNPNASFTAVLNIFFAGVMLAVPYLITGRLALSVGIHFSWNFFQGGVFGFRVSGLEVKHSIIQVVQQGPNWWTGGAFGPEAGLIGLLGILFITLLTLGYLKRKEHPLQISEIFTTPFAERAAYPGISPGPADPQDEAEG